MKAKQSLSPLDDVTIAEYLRHNPGFFDQHADLLADLQLPHQSGEAVSLVERQISVLRSRNTELRKQLKFLLSTANDNNALFEKVCDMTLALIDTRTLLDVDLVLAEKLAIQFAAEYVVCYVCNKPENSQDEKQRRGESGVHIRFADALPQISLMKSSEVVCGPIRPEEFSVLFPYASAISGSAVLVPLTMKLSRKSTLSSEDVIVGGLLAIGSNDPERFSSDLGTVFLKFMGDILSRVLESVLYKDADSTSMQSLK